MAIAAYGRPKPASNKPGAFVIPVDPEGNIAHVNPDGTYGHADPPTATPTVANWATPGGNFGDGLTEWPDGATIAVFVPNSAGGVVTALGLLSTGVL
jgi:streptogramin lyase